MRISGHKTRSGFERYNTVSENDLKKASQRIKEYHQEVAGALSSYNSATVQAQEAQLQLKEKPVEH
jgi:hypothetical protein